MGALDTAIIEAHAGHERARRELLADIEAIERRIARDQEALAESRRALAEVDAAIAALYALVGSRAPTVTPPDPSRPWPTEPSGYADEGDW